MARRKQTQSASLLPPTPEDGDPDRCRQCGSSETLTIVETSDSVHYARIVCGGPLQHFLKWAPKPQVYHCPFQILIDTREKQPYEFQGLVSNADQGSLPIEVKTARVTIHNGDYQIAGLENRIAIERKSLEDLYGSVAQRRENFEERLERMASECGRSFVIVEAERSVLLANPPQFTQYSPKSLSRTLLAWDFRFPTKWCFMASRALAMAMTFRLLERAWIDNERTKERQKAALEGFQRGEPFRVGGQEWETFK